VTTINVTDLTLFVSAQSSSHANGSHRTTGYCAVELTLDQAVR